MPFGLQGTGRARAARRPPRCPGGGGRGRPRRGPLEPAARL